MSMPVISVIVPIYNVAEYISGCLDSILAQTFTEFEVICVDDGAQDESGSIAEMYATKDSRVKVIHQENKGLSGARNTGMDAAKGKYIAFCDSDDYYHPDFLKTLYDMIVKENADVSAVELVPTKEKYTGQFPDLTTFKPHIDIFDSPFDTFLTTGKIRTGVPLKLYRRELIKEMRFIEGIYFEDVPFTTFVMEKALKVVVADYPLYYYYTNPNSIMRTSFSVKKVQSYIRLIRYIAAETEKKCPAYILQVRKKILNQRIKMMLNQAVRKQKNINERKVLFDEIQRQVQPLYAEGIISFDGLKPHHKLALYLLIKGKPHLARLVMTIL